MTDLDEKIEEYSLEGLFEMIPDLENKTLLDVGAGQSISCSRAYIKALGKHREQPEQYSKNITLIDERDIHDIIDTETNESIFKEIIKYDITKGLPFEDETFDIIALGRILNHFENVPDAMQLLEEALRVTKQEGYILGDFPLNKIDNEFNGEYKGKVSNITLKSLDGNLVKMVQKKGDDVISEEIISPFDVLIKGSEELAKDMGFKLLINKVGYDTREVYKDTNQIMFYFLAQKN